MNSETVIHQISMKDFEKFIKTNDLKSTIDTSRGLDDSTMLNVTLIWDESSKNWYFDIRKTHDRELLEVVACGIINFSYKVKSLFEKEKVFENQKLATVLKDTVFNYYHNRKGNKDYSIEDKYLI